jgi:hypothetical protein
MNDCRRVRWRFVATLCGIAAVVSMWRPPTDRVAAQPLPPNPSPLAESSRVVVSSKSPYWVGTASCAAASCHGRTAPAGSVGAEYTTYITRDPHAKAYEVLFDERSVRMASLLRDAMSGRPAHESRLCLNCHAPGPAESEPRARNFDRSFGIGCEACHGPARDWLNPHTTAAWQRRGWVGDDGAFKTSVGMIHTKDLPTRVAACAECHVGESGREVTHDLIAAGHPRLVFEFSSSHDWLPKHWRERSTKSDPRPRDRDLHADWDARTWTVGQFVTAFMARRLTARHRDRQEADSTDAGPWLEFADFDCGACHQPVRPGGVPLIADSTRRIGSLVPVVWPETMLPQARKLVGRQATGQSLRDVLSELGSRPLEMPVVRAIVHEVVKTTEPASIGWDRAAQTALALQALHRTLRVRQPQPNDGAVSRQIDDLVADVWPRDASGKPLDPGSAAATFQPERFAARLRELRNATP